MAMRGIFFHLALAVVIGAGCGSPGSGAADLASVETPAPTAAPALDAKGIVRWRKPDSEARLAAALPQQGVVVAFTRWGETTLGVFDVGGAKMIPLAKRETGTLIVSQGGSRLVILVREGPSPARNHIEMFDWRSGSGLIVEPATDDAVLGFAVDAEGKQLSYATMNLRNSRSADVTWRVGLLDLERRQARIVIDSAAKMSHGEGILVPFAWSGRTGRLYLQGWSPFRGMIRQSIWAMSPERGEPARIVLAPNYAGVPRLSPDGARLAYLGTDMGSLPADFVAAPGAPPGNGLLVMDLKTGGADAWARGGKTAFGALAWSANGEEVVVAEQAWLNGRFRDVEVRRIGEGTAVSVAKIDSSQSVKEVASILECRERNLFWVEKERAAAKLYVNRGGTSQLLFELPDGAIELLGCQNR
ncbi:MAG: hypothetical protein Q8S00_18390 [Deltaproteobacteria bacterium]|nr:hypothetical protein [Deltaproteobacteria bacterium]MDZ4343149.1 hypothetical protein [Candidatus Binatia bacterium]